MSRGYMLRGVVAVAMAAVALVAVPPASGDSDTGEHWHASNVEYVMSRSLSENWPEAVQRAAAEWRSRTRFNIQTGHVVFTDSTNPNTADHIVWRGSIPSAWQTGCPPSTTLACNRREANANQHITDSDFVFNRDQDLGTSDLYRCTFGIGADVESVALHEFGHFGGLTHDPNASTVMAPVYAGCRRELTATDVRSMQNNYPGH